MIKQGIYRTLSICLNDIPKDRIFKHENGKMYLSLSTYDHETDQYDNDFSVSMPLTKEEQEAKKEGKEIKRIFLGNGRIYEPVSKMQPATQEDVEDLPF